MTSTAVCLETGSRRVFASALDWPGWCRSGRTEDEALDVLARYAVRYRPVVERAGARLPARAADDLEVVERLEGSATTDFGAPGAVAGAEAAPIGAVAAKRMAALVTASWGLFDVVVARAPAALRKGPRGGGRDRDEIDRHVAEAELAYARKLGVKGAGDETGRRRAIVEVLARRSDGSPPVERGWPTRYGARRIAWHVLDHAWEIEDRSDPG